MTIKEMNLNIFYRIMKYSKIIQVIVMAASCACVAVAADKSHYTIKVDDFSELNVVNAINVDYVCSTDSAGLAVFDATPDMASLLMFSNNGKNRLTIQTATDGVKYTGLPTVRVYSNFLTKVENSGDSLVRVLTVAPGPKFTATLIGNGRLSVRDITANQVDASIKTGNGQMAVSGKCQNANLHNTGAGSIQADGLVATNTKCSVVGTGTIGCYVKENLSVQGMGTGKVYYVGEPSKIKNRSMGIKYMKLGEEKD